jgi:hypothetical protein
MTTKPIASSAITQFQDETTTIPLSDLDDNFSAVLAVVNDANTYSNYAVATGSVNAYAISIPDITTTYTEGLRIQFKANSTNTGSVTLNVNSQGTKNVYDSNGTALTANTILNGSIYDVIYDGINFRLQGSAVLSGLGSASAGVVVKKADSTYTSRTVAVSGTGLAITNPTGDAGNITITSNATSANTASTLVARDSSGNFVAGTITAALSGNASTATSATTATNLAGGSGGRIAYQSGAGTTAFSAAGTSGQFLLSGGTGAPTWGTPFATGSVAGLIKIGTGLSIDGSGVVSAATVVDGTKSVKGILQVGNGIAVSSGVISLSGTNGLAVSTDSIGISSTTDITLQRVFLGNGTAASPSLAWDADTGKNTGFYWGLEGYTYFSNNGTKSGEIQPGGNLVMVGNVTAYSDERLKTDIITIDNALSMVDQMRGVYFVKDGNKNTGVIAQEIQKVLPEVVLENSDGYLSVAYGNIVGVLIEAIKELKAEVESLKNKE